MSNLGFDETINEIGGYVIRTDIGDKYVLKMLSTNSLLGVNNLDILSFYHTVLMEMVS